MIAFKKFEYIRGCWHLCSVKKQLPNNYFTMKKLAQKIVQKSKKLLIKKLFIIVIKGAITMAPGTLITNAQTVCSPGNVNVRVYTGYGIDYSTVNSVTNPARAMGIPNTTRYAVLVHTASAATNGQLTITLGNTVAMGDTIKIIAAGVDATAVSFSVSGSANNSTYSPTVNYSVNSSTMATIIYPVTWAAGVKYIRIKNNSTAKDLRIDAVSYIYKACYPNCMGGNLTYISGNAMVPLPISTCTNPTYSCGGCDNSGSTQTSAQLLVVDLGQVVPFGTQVQCFLASSSATVQAVFTVSASLSNTTYVDAQTISAKILQPDFAGYTYTVNQPGGIRYVKFQTTGSASGYVDAVTFQFPSYWGKDYITGTAFFDTNNDGIKNGIETGNAGINVKLYKDRNNNGIYDQPDVFKQSTNTVAGGNYTFQITQNDTNYVVVLSPNTLPAGMVPNTSPYQTAVFNSMNLTDCGNDFGYHACVGYCPPIAVNDYTTTINGQAVYIPVLSNDYDPNNDINPASLVILHQPTQGTVLISGAQVIYSPIGAFQGLDTFTYIISDLSLPTPLSDTASVVISVISSISSVCDAAVLSHTFFVPGQEQNIRKAFAKMDCHGSGPVTDSMRSIISIKIPYPGCIITFDHWEDGYESNPNFPSQSTTQVWGDANIFNGIAPGYPTDLIPAGGSIILSNMMGDTNHYAGLIKFDAGDKLISNEDIAVSRIAYDKNRLGLQVYSTDVYDIGRFGTDFIVPLGQDINQTRDFQYTGLFIRAAKNGTMISIDKNSDNIIDITATLNEGQEYFVNGGVFFGANIASTKPVGIDLIFGDTTDCWNSKTLNILPAIYYSNLYYSPVPTTHAPDSCAVMFYNPVMHPITIN